MPQVDFYYSKHLRIQKVFYICRMEDKKLELIALIAKNYGGTRVDSCEHIRTLDGWEYTDTVTTPTNKHVVGENGVGYLLVKEFKETYGVLIYDESGLVIGWEKDITNMNTIYSQEGPDLHEIRNKLTPITTLMHFVETGRLFNLDQDVVDGYIDSAKRSVNALARREVYDDV